MYLISKQILAIGLPVATVAATGMAVAYWTGGGDTETGEATTATAASALTITATSAPEDMAPGVTTGPITVTVENEGTSSVYAAEVVVSIAGVTKAVGAPDGTCDATDYTLSGSPMTTGATTLAPTDSTTFTGATLVFNDKAAIQDACKGATVELSYTASSTTS